MYSLHRMQSKASPVTVVARGELTVVHQKMQRFSRNAWDAERSKKPYKVIDPQASSILEDRCAWRKLATSEMQRWRILLVVSVHVQTAKVCTELRCASQLSEPWMARPTKNIGSVRCGKLPASCTSVVAISI